LIPRRMPTCARQGRHSPSEMKPPEIHDAYVHKRSVYKGMGVALRSAEIPQAAKEKEKMTRTFLMMGSTASVLLEEEEAAARPFGRCESGTRMGLCRRMDRFF
jgi:hypothetical protein